jgi:FkbM family methyltransferase
MPINGKTLRIKLRKNSSDLPVCTQIFEDQEYAFVLDYLSDRTKPYIFLDIGANIGLTSLYLKTHFPNASIYALEPEINSYHSFVEHMRINHITQVQIENKGLYVSDTTLYPSRSFRDGQSWSFALSETQEDAEGNKIEVISLSSLLTRQALDKITLLKIDIEGGEYDLLNDPIFLSEIADRVKLMMIEVHGEVMSVAQAKDILVGAGFMVFQLASSTVCINKRFIHEMAHCL